MAIVPNGVETLPKISIARVGCNGARTLQTERRTGDGIANMSVSSRWFAKNRETDGRLAINLGD